MKLTLYHYWRSSSSWRVRLALFYKNTACELVTVNLLAGEQKNPEHLARNPMGFVPVLKVEQPDGKIHHLGESIAIMEFLDEVSVQKSLLPQDPFDRAFVRQLVQIINSGIQPLHNLKVLNAAATDDAGKKKWAQIWIRDGLQAYETLILKTAKQFSFGDKVTMADLCLIPQIYTANRYQLDLAPYPTLCRVHDELTKLDWVKQAHADQFAP